MERYNVGKIVTHFVNEDKHLKKHEFLHIP